MDTTQNTHLPTDPTVNTARTNEITDMNSEHAQVTTTEHMDTQSPQPTHLEEITTDTPNNNTTEPTPIYDTVRSLTQHPISDALTLPATPDTIYDSSHILTLSIRLTRKKEKNFTFPLTH